MYPLLEAADPNTSGSRLRALATNSYEVVRRKVAKHPNTPSDVLVALLEDPDGWIGWNLAQNPAASPELLDEVALRGRHLDMVAASPNASSKLLSKLAVEPDKKVREAVALNPSSPAKILDVLANDNEQRVRWCVARNKAVPIELLERLSKDSDEKVRRAVARNRNTPSNLKSSLKKALGI